MTEKEIKHIILDLEAEKSSVLPGYPRCIRAVLALQIGDNKSDYIDNDLYQDPEDIINDILNSIKL